MASAKNQFTMLELGAGWGRWIARGAAAAGQLGLPYRLVAVEAEPTHFRWLKDSLQDNGVRPENCKLVWAAVTGKDGNVGFHVGNPAASYGQSIGGPVEVPAVSLATLLEPLDLVDLIDMDVQGAELEILQASRLSLEAKVKRVHVGTHGQQLHVGLTTLFREMGWQCHALFEGNAGDQTSFGRINFQDGVQSWLNPSLHSAEQLRAARVYQNSWAFKGSRAAREIMGRVAPIGTVRRKVAKAVLSGFMRKFRRDPEDERLRPTEW